MATHPFLLASLLVFSGCIAEREPSVRTDAPLLGDSYEYQGSDGSLLRATLVGHENRTNSSMGTESSLLVRWIYSPPIGGGPFEFEEAIGAQHGLIVQQSTHCASWRFYNESEEASCLERPRIFFGAAGDPGAAGASLLWPRPYPTNGDANHAAPVDALETQGYSTARGRGPTGTCWTIQKTPADDLPARGLFFSIRSGPFMVCASHSFPVRFTTELAPPSVFQPDGHSGARVEYVMIDFARGETSTEATDVALHCCPGPRLSPRAWDLPLFMFQGHDPYPFTTARAHEFALRHSTAYADLWNHTDTMLVESRYQISSRSANEILGTQADEHRRVIVAADALGTALRLDLTLVVETDILGGTTERVAIQQERPAEPPWASKPPSLGTRHVSLADAEALGRTLTGQAYGGEPSSYTMRLTEHGWMEPTDRVRDDGLDFRVRYTDPAPVGLSAAPFTVVIDSVSGALVYLDVPQDEGVPF